MLTSRSRWGYVSEDETYYFYCDRWPQQTFIRITKANIEALDSNLLAAMDYYGNQSNAPGRLLATINIWFDVDRILYSDGEDYGNHGYEVEKVTAVNTLHEDGISATILGRRVFQLKPNLWVARDDLGTYRIDLTRGWIDMHFPGGMDRLTAGVTLGLSEEGTAYLLHQPATSAEVALPQLEHAPLT